MSYTPENEVTCGEPNAGEAKRLSKHSAERVPVSTTTLLNSQAADEGEERGIVADALRGLPPLDSFSLTPLTAGATNSSGGAPGAASLSQLPILPPRHDGAWVLTADEEALLFQELVNITADVAPFVSSHSHGKGVVEGGKEDPVQRYRTGRAPQSLPESTEDKNDVSPAAPGASIAGISTAAESETDHALSSSPPIAPGSSAVKCTVSSKVTPSSVVLAKETQEILDAILAAVDGQQSSVSGDLFGVTSGAPLASSSNEAESEDELAAVEHVLEKAKHLASATVMCEAARGELVLHIHEHMPLRQKLTELRKTVGAPTCVALAEVSRYSSSPATDLGHFSRVPPASSSIADSIHCAMGTTLGAVVLFDRRWNVHGVCGSVDSSVVSARGAVVSLSLCVQNHAEHRDESTAVSGHVHGTVVLWSLHSLAPLRIVADEFCTPLLRVTHLHRDSTRVVVLDSSGGVRLLQFRKVITKHMLRSITIISSTTATPIRDIDALPCPSEFYLTKLAAVKEALPASRRPREDTDTGVPWLLSPPPLPPSMTSTAGVSRTSWSTVPMRYAVAAVSNDAVSLYTVEAGLQGNVTGVARHTHPPSSALGNEQVRFLVMESETLTPRVLLCVSWNTELELLLLNMNARTADKGHGSEARAPTLQSLERITLLRVPAPVVHLAPLAGCNVLVLDQDRNAHLMDASVAVMVERHHFRSLEYVEIMSRLSGTKYHGTAASDRASVLLLGKDQAYGISLRSWQERLSALVSRRKFKEALDLAKGFAEEVAVSAVGLSGNAATRRRDLHNYMERILLAYVDSVFGTSSGPADILREESRTSAVIPTDSNTDGGSVTTRSASSHLSVLEKIVVYCSAVDGIDILYGPIARALHEKGILDYLLYVLERCIRRGILNYVPEPLLDRFVDLFMNRDKLHAVEICLGMRKTCDEPGQRKAGRVSEQSAAVMAGFVRENGDSAVAILPDTPDAAELSGPNRVELSLMCLDGADFLQLFRLAEAHGLLRLSVTILSLRQHRYADALAFALDAEEEADKGQVTANVDTSLRRSSCTIEGASSLRAGPDAIASIATEFVECTLKDCSLLPGTEIPVGEQKDAKKTLLEYLLTTNAPSGQPNLCRFLRRQPERAVRVLLFALADEGPCSPWGGPDGLSRTLFVSSVYFVLTGGTPTQPRHKGDSGVLPLSWNGQKPCNLFRFTGLTSASISALRVLNSAELALRTFPPYIAVHTLLSGAALLNDLFLAEGGVSDNGEDESATSPPSPYPGAVRLDIWIDLVIEDAVFVFQHTDTAEERWHLQEQLIRVIVADSAPMDRVATFQADFARLRMARCLAAILCKEGRYSEAIRCYMDPAQNRVDVKLQFDVFGMLRDEMQRLQDRKTQIENRLQLQAAGHSWGFEGNEAEQHNPVHAVGDQKPTSMGGASVDSDAVQMVVSTQLGSVNAAIKALQRAVMSNVEELIRVDATALAKFIFDYLPSNHREVIRLLRGSNAAFLDYLDELMAHGDPVVTNDMNMQNTYIELLCAHAPSRVFSHLQERANGITYDVQRALRAVRKHNIADASIFLLEKTMMIEDAMEVMLLAVREHLGMLRAEVLNRLRGDAEEDVSPGNTVPSVNFHHTVEIRRTSGELQGAALRELHTQSYPFDLTALSSTAQLSRYLALGEELCTKFQKRRNSGVFFDCRDAAFGKGAVSQRGAAISEPGCRQSLRQVHWFRLLDVFMVPRRLLCEIVAQDDALREETGAAQTSSPPQDTGLTGSINELEVANHIAAASQSEYLVRQNGARSAASPLAVTQDLPSEHLPVLRTPLSPGQRHCVDGLIGVYTQYTSDVLRSMMRSLDLTVVVEKVVRDNQHEAFRAFKPVILDMMSSLRFDLEASRLCAMTTESDVTQLSRRLYKRLNMGVVPESDSCALCHAHLSEPPSLEYWQTAKVSCATPPSACVYFCGHAFHSCCATADPSRSSSGCLICAQKRFAGQTIGGGAALLNQNSSPLPVQPSTVCKSVTRADSACCEEEQRGHFHFDVAHMQRRIRQTKMKIDRTDDLYPILKSFLMWETEPPPPRSRTTVSPAAATTISEVKPHPPHDTTVVGASDNTENWVLAPSPRIPLTIGEVKPCASTGTRPTGENDLDVETLTDAEILELFGGC